MSNSKSDIWQGEAREKPLAVNNSIQVLYEQAKRMWKGVVFEILLEPLDPQSGETAERHLIDFHSCEHDINEARNVGRLLPFNELFREIGKLPDYSKLLHSAHHAIDLIKEEYDSGRQSVSESEPEWGPDSESEPDVEEEPELHSEAESEPIYEVSSSSDDDDSASVGHIFGSGCFENMFDVETEKDCTLEHNCDDEYPQLVFPYGDILILGPHGTRLSRWDFEAISWESPAETTRALLSLILGEYILAINSLNENALPGDHGPAREEHRLNPQYIADIVSLICSHYNICQQEVISIIKITCAEAENIYHENVVNTAKRN